MGVFLFYKVCFCRTIGFPHVRGGVSKVGLGLGAVAGRSGLRHQRDAGCEVGLCARGVEEDLDHLAAGDQRMRGGRRADPAGRVVELHDRRLQRLVLHATFGDVDRLELALGGKLEVEASGVGGGIGVAAVSVGHEDPLGGHLSLRHVQPQRARHAGAERPGGQRGWRHDLGHGHRGSRGSDPHGHDLRGGRLARQGGKGGQQVGRQGGGAGADLRRRLDVREGALQVALVHAPLAGRADHAVSERASIG